MKEFIRVRAKRERISRMTGIGLTVLLHAGLIGVCATHGLNYLDPPPPENSFLMDFSEVQELPVEKPKPRSTQPRSENVDLSRPPELVQRAESQYAENIKENLTPQSADDDFGDVPVPETKPEQKLDPRASFPGMARKDTTLTAPHSAEKATDQFKSGRADGNLVAGKDVGTPSAHLKGRTVVLGPAKPDYSAQLEGIVVVRIIVNQEGKVVTAIPGVEGTTVADKTLWAASRKAAFETYFNNDPTAPPTQEGTITYVFKLK